MPRSRSSLLGSEDLGHRAGSLPPPHLELEQAVAGHVIALREEKVSFVFGIDMRNTPAVLDDLNRLAQAGAE